MTEPENDNAATGTPELSARPTIHMKGNPAIDAPPPQDDGGVDFSETSTPSSTDPAPSGDIWSTPALASLPAPEESTNDQDTLSDEPEASDGDLDASASGISEVDLAALASASQPTPSDLNSTSAAVRLWANEGGVESDPYVVELTDDLMGRRRLTYWASLNPLDHLPSARPKAGRRLKAAARVVLLFRNVGVFVPVALTWLAINKATDAFGNYVEQVANTEKDVTVNFLQFWQSGGPGGELLGSSWRIQHIAFLDALIIAAIILLTLVAGALDGRANAQVARQQLVADQERTRIALLIGKALHGNRSASPESISEALALALTDLSEAARNVATATSRLEDSTSSFDSLKPRLESLSQQITNLNRHFATDVVNSVSSLSSSVGTLGTTLGGDMNRFLSEVLAGIEEINESFKKTSVTVEFGTKQLRDDLDAIHRSLSQVVGRR